MRRCLVFGFQICPTFVSNCFHLMSPPKPGFWDRCDWQISSNFSIWLGSVVNVCCASLVSKFYIYSDSWLTFRSIPSLKLTYILWKSTPGKGDSCWKPSFLGAMLVSGSVKHHKTELIFLPAAHHEPAPFYITIARQYAKLMHPKILH